MLSELSGVTGLLALIALAPGLACWWQGRTLKLLVDDAALPERLLAAQRRNGAMFGVASVCLGAISMHALPWTLPLMATGCVVASYPLRKALFCETWSLATYVWFVARFFVGIWGFWIALTITPMLAGSAGSFDWLAGLAIATLLVIWNARYADVLRFILRARPVEDTALLSRFDAMVQRSGIAMPRFERVDLHGGAVANALAVPSLRRSSVVFTGTLLDRLEPDETVAICAHELAHLEHFNPRLLRRLKLVSLLLIASGAAVAPLTRLAGLSSSLLPLFFWVIGLVIVMAWRARDRQRNETASDLRAVALCGDSEALIRALTRLHTMARVPRRFDAMHEQRATHPSLARRIRDIRAAAGTTGATLETTASFRGTDGRSIVTFARDTLEWSEGEAAVHSLSYAYLAELRLEVRGSRPASLIALERAGRRWELPLAAEDLERAQAVLDIVDAQLPAPVAPAALWPQINRLVLGIGAVIGLLLGQVAMAFVALLALLQPAAPLLAAAGIASLAAAGVLVRHGGIDGGVVGQIALLVAAFGAVLLYMARSKREEEIPRRATIPAALLGAFAALSVAMVTVGGLDPVRIHQSARSATGAPVLLLAFAGALTLWRSRVAQYAAIPVIMVAAATSLAASTTFLDRFGRDPFLVSTESLAWKTVTGDSVAEFSVPFSASGLQLSPGGRHVAIMSRNDEREDNEPATFHVGRAGGTLEPVIADDLIFVDDEHILLVRSEENGVELRQLKAGSLETVIWRAHIPHIASAELSFKAATRRWRVMGWDGKRVVRAEGLLGDPAIQRAQWLASANEVGWIESIASSGSDALLVESSYNIGFLQRQCPWRWWALLFQPDTETRFRAVGNGTAADIAVSRLDAQCFAAALENDELLCGAFDGTRTRFIAIDPASKRVAGVAWLNGRFATIGSSRGEWLAGWRDSSPVALNLRRREAIQVAGDGPDRIFQIAASDRLFGTIAFRHTGSMVRLYRKD